MSVHPTTQILFGALGRALTRDVDGDDSSLLAGWLDGPGHLLGAIDDLVRGEGWTDVLSTEASPAVWLGWVGQFAGVEPLRGLTESAQRARVRETAGQQRGTPAAIVGAAQQMLSGSRLVLLEERTDAAGAHDAYMLRVTTYEFETAGDGAQVEQAILEQKPAGLVLHYRLLAGATYQQVSADFATYAALSAALPTYGDMRSYVPTVE